MAGIKELMEKMESDVAFRETIQSAADKAELVSRIQEAGFDVTFEEFVKAVSAKSGELSDDELESAVGGNSFWASLEKDGMVMKKRMQELREELKRTDLHIDERIMLEEELCKLIDILLGD